MTRALPFIFLFLYIVFDSQAADCSGGRYIDEVFHQVQITRNIQYARKKQSDGQFINLRYDVYEPQGDTASLRPVMMLIHGGAYLKLLDQNSPDIVLMCEYFAKRGYVAVSIDYRQEPNPFSLFSEESMVKAVTRALLDTKDAVDHLMLTYQNGNPYRIDTSKAIIGGVSAGAVSTMFISYLDSLHMMPEKYWPWVIAASDGMNADSILRHRFDLVKPKIAISVSGALLDTSWIRPNNIDMLLVHGSYDQFVPYTSGFPLGILTLPKLYGGKAQYPRMIGQGIRCEFEDWIGRGHVHVPFMNLDVGSILTFQLINQPILDSTERHIAHFCYPLMDCSMLTSVRNNSTQGFRIFPNPSTGRFKLELGGRIHTVTITDVTGRQVYQANTLHMETVEVNTSLPSGMYMILLTGDTDKVYTSKLVVQ
jgi:acetyl esterase/lipase